MDLLIIFTSCLFGYLCGRLDANTWHRSKCKYILETFDKEHEQTRKELHELARAVIEAENRFMTVMDKSIFRREFSNQIELAKKVSEQNGIS